VPHHRRTFEDVADGASDVLLWLLSPLPPRVVKRLVVCESSCANHRVTTNRMEPLWPKTSGRYMSSAWAGATMNVPGVVARAM
jgi:hypothetical protein